MVVLTALTEEKAAILAAVGEANCEVIRGVGDIHVASWGAFRIAVVSLLGMGNVGASAAAREVIETWRPRFLVLVGIAAGIGGHAKDPQLGDVLVADQVVGFELAKVTADGPQRRYQSFRPHFDLLAAAHAVAADEWTPMIATPRPGGQDAPRVRVGTVLSGEKVFADIASVQEIRHAWPAAIGVEMEGLGVALAAYRGGSGFLLVKGVSDFADAGKDDRWRGYAAEAAARFTLAVLRRAQPAPATPVSGPRPQQLPRDATWFTGRGAELEDLLAMATDSHLMPAGPTVMISAIDGMAGIGKTALAVHTARRLAGRFPDGQLFLDLHGFTEGMAPVGPADALDRLLRDVGVPGERIPAGLEERAALWRSVLAGRRMLIVLDNAAAEAQVQPLIPGAAGCLVLVTSRRCLAALEATHVVSLDTLPEADAVKLLIRTANRPELIADTPDSMAELVEVVQLCGGLPLAIRIAAARLKHRRAWTVADLAQRLRGLDQRLTALDDGQRSVSVALHLSYQYLSPDAQRLYRLLGLHPGPDVEPYAAAALAATGLDGVRRLLDGLVDHHLLQEPTPGRYRFHDLVRAHAVDTATSEATESPRRAALDRLLDHYRHTAATAMDAAYPHERKRRPTVPAVDTPTPDLTDRARANRWLDTELANLLAAAQHAATHNLPEHTWQLSAILGRHLLTRGRHRDAHTLHQHAFDLARRFGNHQAELEALNGLGDVHRRLGRAEQSGDHYRRALQIAQDIGDHNGELDALDGLGTVYWLLGRHELAGDHYQRALHIAQDVGDLVGERNALQGLGDIRRMLGHHEQAGDHYRLALQIAQDIGHRNGELQALNGLGHIHRAQGRHEHAADCYQQVFDLAHEIGSSNWQFEALQGLGRLHHATGHPELALTHHAQALRYATDLAQPTDQARAHDGLAHAHHTLNQHDQARRHWQHALDILTNLGTDHTEEDQTSVPSIRTHLTDLDQRQPPLQ